MYRHSPRCDYCFRSSKPQLLLAESVGFFGSGCPSGCPAWLITQLTSDWLILFCQPFQPSTKVTLNSGAIEVNRKTDHNPTFLWMRCVKRDSNSEISHVLVEKNLSRLLTERAQHAHCCFSIEEEKKCRISSPMWMEGLSEIRGHPALASLSTAARMARSAFRSGSATRTTT